MLDGEKQVIIDAIGGEASAFGLLYDHYHPAIYRFVLIKVGRREEAEDLTHQVFLSAWQNIKKYKDLGYPFGSWLYQIARNQVIDHYRTAKRTQSLEDLDPDYAVSSSDDEADTENKLEMEKIKTALTKLKPLYQDIVIMRFIEELSIKETAAALGKSEGAIKLLQHRAIKQLRTVLEKKQWTFFTS